MNDRTYRFPLDEEGSGPWALTPVASYLLTLDQDLPTPIGMDTDAIPFIPWHSVSDICDNWGHQ
jgi:hypothetical protein